MKLSMALLARALALSWAAFWMVFFVAESWAWRTPLGWALPWVGVGLLFLSLALVPWRWETVGGVLLVTTGLFAGVAYTIWSPKQLPVAGRVLTIVVFSGPPLAAGILFLKHRRGLTARS